MENKPKWLSKGTLPFSFAEMMRPKFLKMFLILVVLIQSLAFTSSANPSCITTERDSLLEFKQSLKVNTTHPKQFLSWVGQDCCEWNGVSCSNKTGHVLKLDLRNPIQISLDDFNIESYYEKLSESCLGGEISPSLLGLQSLEYLDLSSNCFDDKVIPGFLGSFKNLKYLNLSYSDFGGKVPHHLGNLSSLEYLDLNWNSDLRIDNLNWVSALSSLKYLDLSEVHAGNDKNWLLAINRLPSLIELHLYACHLAGFPLSLRPNLTSLVVLDLRDNYFDSHIPDWFFNMSSALGLLDLSGNNFQGTILPQIVKYTSLQFLDLSYNNFEGDLPKAFWSLCNLQELHLPDNKFSGEIFESLGNTSGCIHNYLEILDLSGNHFRGTLPDMLGQFKNLEYIHLTYNSFTGPIPASIGNLSSLKHLYLGNNQLGGSIPESVGLLSSLEILDFSDNQLGGVVSELHLRKLNSLRKLYMHNNSLQFQIDPKWTPAFQLEWVSLSSCKLGPKFPGWFRTQKNITILWMSNASISDSIPEWFESISGSIALLDLSHNQINKHLPKLRKLRNSSGDRFIFLEFNKFDGPLTPFPSNVIVLDLSHNLLSGHLPQTFGRMMPDLQFLSLAGNRFNGSIPVSFCHMDGLQFLDLSKNQLSGQLPQSWEKLQALKVLDLGNNNLTGRIPESLGSLKELESLHLQHNILQGRIPLSLRKLKSLRTLDLGWNAFTGLIPPWIGENLSLLRLLDVQSNKFTGQIPLQLCRLAYLSILNLADNSMNGTIPPCFQNFTAMVESNKSLESDEWSFHLESYASNVTGKTADYHDNVEAHVKGIELEYTKTIRFFVSIDLSGNNIVGEIPVELMRLSGLWNLNLSRNRLHGHIPTEIGKLILLESLDLSGNELSGSIPPSISNLNFLSFLNLSFNDLSGRIPSGNQLQTLNEKSIYMGNNELCGPPLRKCAEDESPERPEEVEKPKREADSDELGWFYCGLGVGFFAGFVGVCSSLCFNNSWRYAWFRLVDRIWVMAAVKANQLRRKFHYNEI